jgi:hypothetical protein
MQSIFHECEGRGRVVTIEVGRQPHGTPQLSVRTPGEHNSASDDVHNAVQFIHFNRVDQIDSFMLPDHSTPFGQDQATAAAADI